RRPACRSCTRTSRPWPQVNAWEPQRRRELVTEVPALGEEHRRAGGLDCGDDFLVALRPAGLDDRRDAGFERELRAVGEGEERIACEDGAAHVVPVLARLLERDLDGVDTAHLTGADP